MTKKEYIQKIEDCHLEPEEEIFLREKTSSKKTPSDEHYEFFDSKTDQYLEYLVEQTIQTIAEEDNKIHWKPIVFTRPNKKGLDAKSLSINKEYKLLILDTNAMKLYGDISKLIDKLAPKYKGEITPNPENFNIEDLKKEIRESINENDDVYNEFKKIILAFNGKMVNYIDDEKEPVGIAKRIRDACMLFLIGHEFAHIWKKHRIIGDNEEDAIKKRWDQEAEADIIAYKLMFKTMERLYPEIIYKGQFDLGFEIFFQCLAINEPLLIIFDKEKYEYNTTHPDASSSRLEILRLYTIKSSSDKEEKKTHIFNIWVSNEIFDNVSNKLISEILCIAANLDKQKIEISDDKIFKNICNTESIDGNIPEMYEWKEEHYISAVRKFIDGKYSQRFYKILAIFYDYILERSSLRMYSYIGQEECFRNGIEYLNQDKYDHAIICFLDALNQQDNIITRLAYGVTCYKLGQCFLEKKKNYEKAGNFFGRDIEMNYLAGRKSFEGRMEALKEQNKLPPESEDGKIFEILSSVPSRAERVIDFMKDNSIFIK